MSKSTWITGRYNSYDLDLGLLKLTCSWSTVSGKPGYTWSSNTGHRPPRIYKELREAQDAAESWAVKALSDAMSRCP
jgi:hypothetical protein